MTEPAGYLSPLYAQSLAEFGEPRELSDCGGWVLIRPIPGCNAKDAMGCYPLFACKHWDRIHEDLIVLKDDLVSFVCVTDPFAEVEHKYLMHHFDVAKPFKKHLITRLTASCESEINKHHRYYARRSLRDMDVQIIQQPTMLINEWCDLYNNLIIRHKITGMQAFSRKCFEKQLKLPGLFMVVGRHKGNNQILGIHLVICQGDFSYSHLAAFSQKGYEISAAYGIYLETLKALQLKGCRFFDLGSVAGCADEHKNGLSRFKKGWSNDCRLVYLCGKILNQVQYDLLKKKQTSKPDVFFPCYRNHI